LREKRRQALRGYCWCFWSTKDRVWTGVKYRGGTGGWWKATRGVEGKEIENEVFRGGHNSRNKREPDNDAHELVRTWNQAIAEGSKTLYYE
jgi:hypothetical protein